METKPTPRHNRPRTPEIDAGSIDALSSLPDPDHGDGQAAASAASAQTDGFGTGSGGVARVIDVSELKALAERLTAAGRHVMQIQTTAAELPDVGTDLYRRSNRDVVITSDGTEHAVDGGSQ